MKIFQLFRLKLITSAVALLAIATLSGCAQSSQSQSVVNVTAKNVSMKNTSSNQSNTAHQVLSEFTVPKYVLLRNEQKAIEEPNNYQDQMSAAISYHLQGNDKKAIAYYKTAIQINPNSGQPYNNIGNIYLHFFHEPQVAISYYEKAIKVQPGDGYGWLNLAMARKQVGNVAGAKLAVQNGLKRVNSTTSWSVYQMLQEYEKQFQASR